MELDDDEYIGKEIIGVYDSSKHILALQRNFHSLGASGVEKYINEMWSNKQLCVIHLRPIMPLISGIDRLRRRGSVTKLQIGFSTIEDNTSEFFNNKSIKNIVDEFNDAGGLCGSITISVGRQSGKKNLNKEVINQIADDIGKNKNIITQAHVSYKEDETTPIEYLDLIKDKMHDYIELEVESKRSIPRDHIISAMIDKFIERFGNN